MNTSVASTPLYCALPTLLQMYFEERVQDCDPEHLELGSRKYQADELPSLLLEPRRGSENGSTVLPRRIAVVDGDNVLGERGFEPAPVIGKPCAPDLLSHLKELGAHGGLPSSNGRHCYETAENQNGRA